MKRVFGHILMFVLIFISFTCKKKTSIDARLFNPALNEYVPNATIVLVERYNGGLLSNNSSCKEVASATTDANGNCAFDSEKLRWRSNYDYYLAVKQSWGLDQSYPCGGKTSGFIGKGKTNEEIVIDDVDGTLQIQYNNLLNPSQPGDSLIVGLITIEYPNPKGGVVQGGGEVFVDFPHFDPSNPPNYPPVKISGEMAVKAQRLERFVRKRKMGIVTTTIDTIKIYPNRTNVVEIDW